MLRKSTPTVPVPVDADSQTYAKAFRNFAITAGVTIGVTFVAGVVLVNKIRTQDDSE